MEKSIIKTLCLFLLLTGFLYSQIDSDAPDDWSRAGYRGDIPRTFDAVINMKEVYSLKGDGATDDAPQIQKAINNKINYYPDKFIVLFFPAGNYVLGSTITIPAGASKLVIMGEGSDKTQFTATHSNIVFNITPSSQPGLVAVPSGYYYQYNRGSTSIQVPFSSIQQNDFIEIKVNDGYWYDHYSSSNPYTVTDSDVGQIIKVIGVTPSVGSATVTLEDPLRLDYGLNTGYDNVVYDLHPQVQKIITVNNIGFENFTLYNASSGGTSSYNFIFQYATDCWMWGVQSQRPYTAHVSITRSSGIEIRGCYFYDAQAFGGGQGYGITINAHSTDCLVEDNVFNILRHAMMVQNGANGNVFGFNFSDNQTSPGQGDNGDISFHGHFPYDNLFEGNMGLFADADAYWGSNGPRNTLFRNVLRRTPFNICNNASYVEHSGGIRILGPYVSGQEIPQYFHILGNTVQRAFCISTQTDQLALYFRAEESPVNGYNAANGDVKNYAGYPAGRGYSLYRNSQPSFLTSAYSWPPVGCMLGSFEPNQSIPARDRFYNQNIKTVSSPYYSTTGTEIVASIDQKLQDGITTVDSIARWESAQFKSYAAPKPFLFIVGQNAILRGTQKIVSGQKYNKWIKGTTDEQDVANHHLFLITTGFPGSVTSQFSPTYSGATIQNSLEGGAAGGGTIDFKDPWLIDYADPNYGNNLRNQGMNAPFKTRSSPFHPDYTTSYSGDVYKGVFLNQNPSFDPKLPNYSVSAPLTPTVNGSTAFFQGWSYSGASLQQVGTSPAGYDQKAVVFNTGGASVTANYSYSTINTNTTLNAGTYNIAGTLTVAAGVTLTVNSGAALNFPYGGGLVVNGILVTNGGTFTSNSSSWNGITLNSSNGSSIQYAVISKALSPIVINSTSSITISSCTINNSSFYGGNSSTAAAIQVFSSSPNIFDVTINGNGVLGYDGSWNGVRFTNSSGGSLRSCTIQNLGYGNGVIVQGGSSPTIIYNNINHNYYHGIVVFQNGTGSPVITGNTFDYNGLGGSYIGIHFYTSSGTVRMNTVSHSYYGIWCRYSSSLTAGGVNQTGSNTIINNTIGLVATDNSSMLLGDGIAQKNEYWGVCNEIYGNSQYDAVSETGSNLMARFNWWGQYPLNQSKFYVDGSSSLDNSYPETSANGCPLGGGVLFAAQRSGWTASSSVNDTGFPTQPETNPADEVRLAMENKFRGNYTTAISLCRNLLKNSRAAFFHKQALAILFNIFQAAGDNLSAGEAEKIADDLKGFALSNGGKAEGSYAKLLLAQVYAAMGKTDYAETVANELKAAKIDSETEEQALLTLASLSAFNPSYKSKSETAVKELVEKYGSSVDKGLLAMFGFSDKAQDLSMSAEQKQLNKKDNDEAADSVLTYQLDNYPNPFNPSTVIKYQLPKDGFVTLKVYDILGREVKTLVNEYQTKGRYNVTFNAENLASGMYIYQLRSNDFVANKKLMLMK